YEGVVELELLVSGEGKVIEVRLLKSSGRKILDKSAIKGVRRWRYEERRGASAMWITQSLRFSLLDEEERF
ncbi:MAG: energy transducer TonB, partial [Desulfobacterales bacterium]|nr:energy transducer TonB [Desulfobacterales bacterium]